MSHTIVSKERKCKRGNIVTFINFRPHYNLDLQSIVVGEQLLGIDPTVFETSDNRGTIVDTGTTLTYLSPQAYYPFVDAVSFAFKLFL